MGFKQFSTIVIVVASLCCLGVEAEENGANNSALSPNQTLADLIFGGSRMVTYLLTDSAVSRLNPYDPIDAKISRLLKNNYIDIATATSEVVERAWQLMHQHAEVVVENWVNEAWPIIDQSLRIANVSEECHEAAHNTLQHATHLDRWAIQRKYLKTPGCSSQRLSTNNHLALTVMTAWGSFPPTGLYDGTTGDPGSYLDCVTSPVNSIIGHAHYCSIQYQPIVPDNRYYDLIVRKKPELLHYMLDEAYKATRGPLAANQTYDLHDDAFSEWLMETLPLHKIELEWGTCFPIKCSPFDVQKVAGLLASQAAIQMNYVSCSSKFEDDYEGSLDGNNSPQLQISIDEDVNNGVYVWKPHITLAQKISLVVIAAVTGAILFLTLVDIFMIKLPAVYRRSLDANVHGTNPKFLGESLQTDLKNPKKGGDNILTNKLTPPQELSKIIESSRKGNQKTLLQNLVEGCSIINNFKRMFRVPDEDRLDPGQIPCIDGLRCITCIVIVIRSALIRMNHVPYVFFAPDAPVDFGTLTAQFFMGPNWVDTFFLVSGLINSFSISRKSLTRADDDVRSSNFSVRSHIIKRYLRLVPSLLLTAPFYILLPAITEIGGSHWYQYVGPNSERCSTGWWAQLFFIQALYSRRCNSVSWYLSIDMLFYLIAVVVIVLQLHYGHKATLLSCGFLVFLTEIFNTVQHQRSGLPLDPLAIKPEFPIDTALNYEAQPSVHGIPYFLGFYIGFVLANYPSAVSLWLTRRRCFFGWILFFCLMFIHSFGIHYWTSGGEDLEPSQRTSFYALKQIIWSLCIIWTIVTCRMGPENWINELLSCDLFAIVAKASYVIYLSHHLIIDASLGYLEMADWQTQPLLLYILISIVFGTLVFSILFSIIYEFAWLNLLKKIMNLT